MIAHPDGMQQVTDLALAEPVIDETVSGETVAVEKPGPSCCHYWIIETANGPISRGQCQNCHEIRNFKNSVYDTDREEQEVAAAVSNAPVAEPASPELSQNTLEQAGIAEEPGTREESEVEQLPETAVV